MNTRRVDKKRKLNLIFQKMNPNLNYSRNIERGLSYVYYLVNQMSHLADLDHLIREFLINRTNQLFVMNNHLFPNKELLVNNEAVDPEMSDDLIEELESIGGHLILYVCSGLRSGPHVNYALDWYRLRNLYVLLCDILANNGIEALDIPDHVVPPDSRPINGNF